jgi:hypothetical protein
MKMPKVLLIIISLLLISCNRGNQRGIADRRSDFKKFIVMEGAPESYGLKAVRPYFKRANRSELLSAIENACQSRAKSGASIFNPATGAGYYVNCNAANRQLLNGYIPSDARKKPRSGRATAAP